MDEISCWAIPSGPGTFKETPWLHSAAVDYFERLLQPDWYVLEHGAGSSTLWLSGRVAQVYSVEHDPQWYESIQAVARANVELKLWGENVLPPELKGKHFDLMFVDGKPIENRGIYLEAVERLVRPGGWVVLDNCNRPEIYRQRERMQKLCQHYVTFMSHPGMFSNTEFYHLRMA